MNPESVRFLEYAYGTTDYDASVRLRDLVLRRPLGLDIRNDDLAVDATRRHFALVTDTGRLIATLSAQREADGMVRFRQMAVDDACQSRGLGALLFRQTESVFRSEGAKGLHLHARLYAQSFYERLGMSAIGDVFTEVGIPHVTMFKSFETP